MKKVSMFSLIVNQRIHALVWFWEIRNIPLMLSDDSNGLFRLPETVNVTVSQGV